MLVQVNQGGENKTFTLEDYFNPQVNTKKVHSEYPEITFGDLKEYLRQKFTWEVLDYLVVEKNIGGAAYKKAYEAFKTRELEPWVFAISCFKLGGGTTKSVFYRQYAAYVGSSEFCWDERETISLAPETPAQTITKKFNAQLNTYNELFTDREDTVVPLSFFRANGCPYAIRLYMLMDLCDPYVEDFADINAGRGTTGAYWSHLVDRDPSSYTITLSDNTCGWVYNLSPKVKKEMSKHDKSSLYSILEYSTDITRLIPDTFLALEGEFEPPFYGVELEVSTDHDVREVIDAVEELFHICKRDGSLSGSKRNLMEIVTVPASLKAHKRMWAEMFSNLDMTKFDQTKDTQNGMHVHVDRQAFKNPKHLKRFCWFFGNAYNSDFILAVSERTKESFDRWASSPKFKSEGLSGYYKGTSRMPTSKNSAVNMNKAATIEVRIFKGIVSYATLVKNLEFVDAVLNFTRDASLVNYTMDNFVEWLGKTERNKYSVLKEFIKRIDIKKLSDKARLDRLFEAGATPDKILEKVDKFGFTHSPSLATTLNKRLRKKLFTFDKAKGKLTLTNVDKGKLADMDTSLVSRYFKKSA